MALYRIFYKRRWLTPSAIAKVRQERSEGHTGITPEIEYRDKECIEVMEFEHEEDIHAWKQAQNVALPDHEDVLSEYVDIFAVREEKT